MQKEIINTKEAPAAIGPYNQAIKAGNLIITSGQIPIDPKTGQIVEGAIEEQTKQVLSNLSAILTESGITIDNVIKTTCFLNNMDDFAKFNEIYQTVFKENPPARSCVGVERLPLNVLVEVEAIAMT